MECLAEEGTEAPATKGMLRSMAPQPNATNTHRATITPRHQSRQSTTTAPSRLGDPFLTIQNIHAVWQDGTHDSCSINGQHQHATGGGVKFSSLAAFQDMRQKTRIFAPPPPQALVQHLKDEMAEVTRTSLEAIHQRQSSLDRDDQNHVLRNFTNKAGTRDGRNAKQTFTESNDDMTEHPF